MARIIFHGVIFDHLVYSANEEGFKQWTGRPVMNFHKSTALPGLQWKIIQQIGGGRMLGFVLLLPQEEIGDFCLLQGDTCVRLFYQKLHTRPWTWKNGWDDLSEDHSREILLRAEKSKFPKCCKFKKRDFIPTRDWRPPQLTDCIT